MKFAFRSAAALAALVALGGCSLFESKKELPPCPRVSVLSEASKLTQFRTGQGRDITDVELQAEFTGYHGSCKFDYEKQIMTVTMQVGIDAQRGPAAKGRKADIAYFIAIPAFSSTPKGKAIMQVPLEFPENTDRVRYIDSEVEATFKVPKLDDLAKYEVFLGLQLTPEQLEYNRTQKSPM
ncbi:MAG TPA: hypothetical protein VK558_01425 [Patescibacteria group bacterium]|nr:hypothetical protein [Patescibacteria group bacterium]